MTAQGHPRAIFSRAIENGNLVVAEQVAREVPNLTLEEALRSPVPLRGEGSAPLREGGAPLARPLPGEGQGRDPAEGTTRNLRTRGATCWRRRPRGEAAGRVAALNYVPPRS
jgi:hypothetical protein